MQVETPIHVVFQFISLCMNSAITDLSEKKAAASKTTKTHLLPGIKRDHYIMGAIVFLSLSALMGPKGRHQGTEGH